MGMGCFLNTISLIALLILNSKLTDIILKSFTIDAKYKISVVLALALVQWFIVLYLGEGIRFRCPKCKKWWAREGCGSELVKIGEGIENKKVDRTERIKGYMNLEPFTANANITRIEQVYYEKWLDTKYYICKFCNHDWKKQSVIKTT